MIVDVCTSKEVSMDNTSKVDTETVAPATNAADVSQPPKKKKMALWLKILIGVVTGIILFVVVIIIFVFSATSGAVKVSDEFMNDVLANQGSSAYQMFSSEAKKTVTESDFNAIVARMSSVLDETAKQTSREINTNTGSDPTAKVEYEVKGSDGTYTITINLVQENDEWKILNFDSSVNK